MDSPGIVNNQVSYKFQLIDLVWGPIPQRRVDSCAVRCLPDHVQQKPVKESACRPRYRHRMS